MSHDEMSTTNPSFDIDQLLKNYNATLYRFLPKWVIKKIGKLVHIDTVNQIVTENSDASPNEFLEALDQWFSIDTSYTNGERLFDNLDQRPIIVANHPLGGTESVILMHDVAKKYGTVIMITQSLLEMIGPLKPILVSIPNKSNRRENAGQMLKAFSQDEPVLVFPAGICSRELSFGEVYDYHWYKTFVKMARVNNRPIIPVFVSGQNSKRFYRISRWRKRLGLKIPLETALLVDELVKKRNTSLHFVIGEMIPGSTFTTDVDDNEWANRIREYVYLLGKDSTVSFDANKVSTLPLT